MLYMEKAQIRGSTQSTFPRAPRRRWLPNAGLRAGPPT
jgi:hypothetical protein